MSNVKLRWLVDYVYEYVQIGEPIYGPGNKMRRQRVEKRRLQMLVGNEWVDIPEVEGVELDSSAHTQAASSDLTRESDGKTLQRDVLDQIKSTQNLNNELRKLGVSAFCCPKKKHKYENKGTVCIKCGYERKKIR